MITVLLQVRLVKKKKQMYRLGSVVAWSMRVKVTAYQICEVMWFIPQAAEKKGKRKSGMAGRGRGDEERR